MNYKLNKFSIPEIDNLYKMNKNDIAKFSE